MPSKSKPTKGSAGSSRKQSIDETKKVKATKKVVVSSSDSDSDSSVEQKAPVKRPRASSNLSVDKKAPAKVVTK